MKKLIALLLVTMMFSYNTNATDKGKCSFNKIHVGDILSQSDALKKLGINNFITDPKFPDSFDMRSANLFQQYGVNSREIFEDEIGPYCDSSVCVIPNKLKIGYTPINLRIGFEKHTVKYIHVEFNSAFWEDIKRAMNRKFEVNFESEYLKFTIASFNKPKEGRKVIREIIDQSIEGCDILASNVDMIFLHGNKLGSQHGFLEMKEPIKF